MDFQKNPQIRGRHATQMVRPTFNLEHFSGKNTFMHMEERSLRAAIQILHLQNIHIHTYMHIYINTSPAT